MHVLLVYGNSALAVELLIADIAGIGFVGLCVTYQVVVERVLIFVLVATELTGQSGLGSFFVVRFMCEKGFLCFKHLCTNFAYVRPSGTMNVSNMGI